MRTQLLLLLAITCNLFADDPTGAVCIAPVEKSNARVKSLANPSGGNKVQVYSVRIDRRAPLEVSSEHGITVKNLALQERHLVMISGDGKSLTSFHFQFSDYQTRDLCLWMKPLYETWSLTDSKGHGKTCSCLH
jgi:hypothetical protein